MLAASWKAPIFVAPSPKKATDIRPLFVNLLANAAPTEIGTPAPTIPLAPSIARSKSQICMDPPFPLQYPVDLPISSAIIRLKSPPFASR